MFYNPYESINNEALRWLKVNLHVHAGTGNTAGCGIIPLKDAADAYAKAGYDAIALSNHDKYYPRDFVHDRVAFLDGVEYSAAGRAHMIIIGTDQYHDVPHQEAIDRARKEGAFVVICHPNWIDRDHWSVERMMALTGYVGVEVFNAVCDKETTHAMFTNNSGVSADKWDRLLTLGRKAWGFASDDFHRWDDLDKGFNMICAKSPAFGDIKEAVEAGRFYASSGVLLERFEFVDGKITVKTRGNDHRYRFIGARGKLLHQAKGAQAEYAVDPAEHYVRVDATDEHGKAMWLQPILNRQYFQGALNEH